LQPGEYLSRGHAICRSYDYAHSLRVAGLNVIGALEKGWRQKAGRAATGLVNGKRPLIERSVQHRALAAGAIAMWRATAALFAQVLGMECGCPAMIETNTSTLRGAK